MKNKNIPEVRINIFCSKWEKYKLGNLGSFKNGMNFDKDAMGHGYPFVNLQNVFGKTIVEDEFLGLAESTDKERKDYNLLKGDVLFIRSSVKPEGVGEAALITKNLKNTTFSGFIIRFRPNNSINDDFKRIIFKTKSFRTQIMARSTSSANTNINQASLEKITVNLPSVEEQMKIGLFFKNLDDMISLHKQELDALKQTKQGFLQKMFPKEGTTIPETRFFGFHKQWEFKTLGDVLDSIYNGQTPSRNRNDFWNGDINWLTSGELNRGLINTTIEKITELGQRNSNLKVVPKNTLVIAITGLEAAGTRGNCSILGMETTLNQSCMALFPKKNLLDTTFLFQWYRKVGESYGLRFTQGTKQQSYNAEIIKKLEICLPSIEEQIKIGEFFKQLDEVIELKEKEIEALKETKKGFLQKMFV